MNASEAGKAYRQHAIHSESMPDIFIQAYDRVIALLHAAAAATEARDIEGKTHHLNQAFNILGYLQGAIDFERGGDVAKSLNRFYKLLRGEMFKASIALDSDTLRRAADHTAAVRRVWEQAQMIAPTAPAVSQPQPQHMPSVDPGSEMHAPSGSWSA